MNKPYTDWVKTLHCYDCIGEGGDAHHIKGFRLGGTSTKGPDELTIPLCRKCHTRLHAGNGLSRLDQAAGLIRTLSQAFEAGWRLTK